MKRVHEIERESNEKMVWCEDIHMNEVVKMATFIVVGNFTRRRIGAINLKE